MTHLKSKLLIAMAIVSFFYGCTEMGSTFQSAPQKASGAKGFKSIVGTYPGEVSEILATGDSIVVAQKKPVRVMILDPDSGQALVTLTGQSLPVTAMAMSADQKILATADETGGEIRLWDLQKSEVLKSLKPPTQVTSLAFGQQDAILAAGDKDGAISLLDLATEKAVRTLSIPKEKIEGLLKEPPGTIGKIEICPSGRFLAALEKNGALLVWDLGEKERADIHIVPPHRFWNIKFSPDGRYLLASGGSYSISFSVSKGEAEVSIKELGGVLFLRDMNDGKTYSLSTRSMVIENAFFSADGKKVIFQASAPPVSEGLAKLLFVYPVESLLQEEWTKEISKLELGRGPLNQTSVFCPQKSIYALLFQNTLYSWGIQ